MRWWRRHWERVKNAERELEISRARLRETREKVAKPLTEAAVRNNFAEMIRISLIAGHDGRGQGVR